MLTKKETRYLEIHNLIIGLAGVALFIVFFYILTLSPPPPEKVPMAIAGMVVMFIVGAALVITSLALFCNFKRIRIPLPNQHRRLHRRLERVNQTLDEVSSIKSRLPEGNGFKAALEQRQIQLEEARDLLHTEMTDRKMRALDRRAARVARRVSGR